MKKENKIEIVDQLSQELTDNKNFYLADVSQLTVNEVNDLRRLLHENGIKLTVVKNTLIRKAMEKANINDESIFDILKGPSSIMFCDTVNVPAKVIKKYRAKNERPLVKGAFLEDTLYVGDHLLDALSNLKSKEELIADVVLLLKSPMQNLIQALKSAENNISGLVKAIAEKKEKES